MSVKYIPFLLIRHTGTLLPSGALLIIGGTQIVNSYSSCEAYISSSDTWMVLPSLLIARHEHTATLLSSGHVLVTGGQTTQYDLYSSCELFPRL